MTDRVGYLLSALLLGVSALVGLQHSSATFTDDSATPTQVTAARDWTPPTVSVTDPGFVVNGDVNLAATASDADTSVATVEIQYRREGTADWESLCMDEDGSPWGCPWATETVVDGVYELRAIATDEDGNAATSATILTEVYNTAGVVIDPVPSPVRGTVRLTAHMVNVGSGGSRITFQATITGTDNWVDLPSCTALIGPEAFCDFDTTLGASGTTYDLQAVGLKGSTNYYDVQTGILVDNTAPTVTINKAAGQTDPTHVSPIGFTVVFSEPVAGFEDDDVTVGGTSAGTKTATVTGSGTTYHVAVTGMTGDGTVTAAVPAARATDEAGNSNTASTSSDNSVQYDGAPTTVTINQAGGQPDPTTGTTFNYTVVFSRSVTGFSGGDVTLAGTAGGIKTVTVTGSGTTYNVAVSGITGSGTVVATIGAGVATDPYGSGNEASTSTDNTVTRDVTPPTVTVNQAASQADPTNASPINYTVEFSEPVTGFTSTDVTIGGTSTGTKTVVVTGGPTVYNVAVSGMTGTNVTVTASVGTNRVVDLVGNGNTTSSTSDDNTVTRDTTAPTVTVTRASGQSPSTTASPINFTVSFSETVTGFGPGDLVITGTAGGTKVQTVTGSGATYNVAVSGMVGDGTVIAAVPASAATDLAGNGNTATTGAAGSRTVTYDDTVAPTVTIDQAVGQADPSSSSTFDFTAEFSEPVTGFTSSDVTVSGTAGGTKTVTISGSGPTYNVAITGMTSAGTITATIAANKVTDAGANQNTASTSTDDTVTYTGPACTPGSATLTATEDAWTDQSATSTNKGGDSVLVVESKSGANKRAYVKFALPTVPAGCSLTGATLALDNASPVSGRTIDVYRAGSTWTEGGLTWANQPTTAGTAVGSTTSSTAGVQQWSVLDHVDAMYSGTNTGFVLRDRAESAATSPKQSYRSREAGGNPPQLVVNWG